MERLKFFVFAPAVALLLIAAAFPTWLGATPAVRFFAFGDVPYSTIEMATLESLLDEVVNRRPAFLVHVGDVKSGNAPCTARGLGNMADLFKSQPVPVVYTPGDNEWTDCHREGAGDYDPLERLGVLRPLYFGDPAVLRLQELKVVRNEVAFPENYWFVRGGIVFATAHLVGRYNNQDSADPAAMVELGARSDANRRNLRAAVEAANAADATAFVFVFHANPGLEEQVPPLGFEHLHDDLASLLRDFAGPVLAIHGDTHKFRFDHPLQDPETGRVLQRFTRLEVPGSPIVGGVWVSVDPEAAEPFSVELLYPDSYAPIVE